MSTLTKIGRQVGKALKRAGMTKAATLTKVAAGARAPGAVSGGTNSTEVDYTARGFVTSTKETQIGGTLVEANDRVVCLLGALIAGGQVPTNKDKVTIEGTTSRIVGVDRDAAAAVFTLLTRR